MIQKNILNLDQLKKVAGGFGTERKLGQSKVNNSSYKFTELKSPGEYGFLESEQQRYKCDVEQKLIDLFDFSSLQEESKMDAALVGFSFAAIATLFTVGAVLNNKDNSKN